MNAIKGVLKTIYANRWDIISLLAWPALFLFVSALLDGFPGGWVFQNILYALAVIAVCIHAPWVFLAITAPKTWGSFINNRWEATFFCLNGKSNPTETAQFVVVWITYLVVVATLGLVCAAVFLGAPAN